MRLSLLALGAALSLWLGATAAEPGAPGDKAAGEALAATCAPCHGQSGVSASGMWPHLAGQRAAYIEKQLRDLQAGRRADPAMSPMAAPLGDQQIADLAAHFSSLPRPVARGPLRGGDPGAALYLGGAPARRLPPCIGCHGRRGVGIDGVFAGGIPHVGGQQQDYVRKQLQDFRSGARANDDKGVMRAIARKLTDEDIEALSAYVARLR